jgi:D-3-phosphoglycerate dehydrogenase / 2-oxoglutarate reductase
MKILIADKFQASGATVLREMGCEVISKPDCGAENLPAVLAEVNPDVLIVRSTKVNAAAIGSAKRLGLIIRAGAGYDTIDVAEASRHGIFVTNCPGKNSVAVAEVAWGLILACDRRIPDQTADLRAGKWNKGDYSKARGLKGRTLGIVGTGQIGVEIAERGKAFGMKVLGWSRSLNPDKADQLEIGFCPSLVDLVRRSDVVSVSVAANSETEGLIDAEVIAAMRPGTIFINTSRGSVVEEAPLMAAIKEKGIRAGLDVFANEPAGSSGSFTNPIVQLPGVFGTHHVGASTDQAQDAIADEAIRIVSHFLKTGEVCNCVNVAEKTPATSLLTVRHKNQPGVLAHIFDVIGDSQINVEEMENIIYEGAEAACARIQLDKALSADHIAKIQANANVLAVELTRI